MTSTEMLSATEVEGLIAKLWPCGNRLDGPQVYAVVDAARDPRIIGLLNGTGLERCCLFAGALSHALHAAAPHLVHLAPEVRFTREFLRSGWGRGWGVLTVAQPDATLPVLRKHLRSLLRVHDEDGGALMFRFYDPRALRVYLPTCSPAELRRVFGPIQRWVCESGDGAGALLFDGEGMPSPHADESRTRSRCADSAKLTIRAAQFATFEADMRSRTKQRVMAELRATLPPRAVTASDEELRALLDRCESRIDRYAGHFGDDVCRYLRLVLKFGEGWPDEPWASSVFDDCAIPGTSKLDAIQTREPGSTRQVRLN